MDILIEFMSLEATTFPLMYFYGLFFVFSPMGAKEPFLTQLTPHVGHKLLLWSSA